MTTQPEQRGGSVYLLRVEPGLSVTGNRIARHYLGFAERDVDGRVTQHLQRQGSPLVAAVIAAGGRHARARVDRCGPRVRAAAQRRHETPRLRPRCVRDGLTGGRGPLSPGV